MKTDILGVLIDDLTLEEAMAVGKNLLDTDEFHYIVTPNPEFILSAKKNADFCRVLNNATLALPDGIGVVYASRILGQPLKGRVPGIEFAQELMRYLSHTGKTLGCKTRRCGTGGRKSPKSISWAFDLRNA